MRDYKIIGLTGPTGAGKSTVSRVFEENGFAVINADRVAREIMEPGGVCILQLSLVFGSDIVKEDGTLDRRLLAKRAFADKSSAKLLNDITHPRIFLRTLEKCRELIDGGQRLILFDAPVLFESNSDLMCDSTVCVTAPESVRTERLMKRDNISRQAVKQRISVQHGDEFYISRCDYHIDGGKPLDDVKKAAKIIIDNIINR